MNFDEEEEEVPETTEEPLAEPLPDPVEGLPENTANMEFGKTPGGVDTAVAVNNTLTPPSVPGATPAPSSENLFDDAPTDVKKIP
jgi:hypothetical protein